MQLCLSGDWRIAYTTSPLPGAANLRVRVIGQTVLPSTEEPQSSNHLDDKDAEKINTEPRSNLGTNLLGGRLMNVLVWDFMDPESPCSGTFKVDCTYNLNTRGALELKLGE